MSGRSSELTLRVRGRPTSNWSTAGRIAGDLKSIFRSPLSLIVTPWQLTIRSLQPFSSSFNEIPTIFADALIVYLYRSVKYARGGDFGISNIYIEQHDFVDLSYERQSWRFLHPGVPPMRAGLPIERCGAGVLSALLLEGKCEKQAFRYFLRSRRGRKRLNSDPRSASFLA